MSRSWMFVCAASLAAYAGGGCQAAASSEPRLQLTFSGEETSSSLSVQGGAGGTFAMASTTLNLKLHLAATPQPAADAYRLIVSSVFLKAEGPDRGKSLQSIGVGSLAADVNEEVSLAIDPLGPVAQNAKAVCAAQNGAAAKRREVAMLVPVVWRVTSGAFAFTRLAAAGLTPEEAMLSDAAYYGDAASEDAETSVAVTVLCKDVPVAALTQPRDGAEQKGKPARVQQAIASVQDKPRVISSELAAAEAPKVTPVHETEASVSPLRCDGGIVRETLAGAGHEVCLCPGNTERRAIADRAYTCEKRLARSR